MKTQHAFHVRPARSVDQKSIRKLVRSARLNPLSLDWRRFKVAVNESDRVIGCGQVKPHMDGSRELASVVVEEEWRRQGIASHLIKSIMSGEKPPLWLTCRRELTGFYAQLGFTEVERDEDLSPYFTRISNFLKVYHQLIPGDLKISIMVWFGETGESKRL